MMQMQQVQDAPRRRDAAILSLALLLRILVGFHPHSGQDDYQGPNAPNTPTNVARAKYGGDYEAQRHWMEVTYHLPLGEWYYHDLEYWGLDYPPLTAYVSWCYGWVAHTVGSIPRGALIEDGESEQTSDAEAGVCEGDVSVCTDAKSNAKRSSRGLVALKDLVALHSSRWGSEDPGGKLYMRFTVLLSDMLVYVSAVWVLATRLTNEEGECDATDSRNPARSRVSTLASTKNDGDAIVPVAQRPRVWLLLTALSQPALILIDHGHFQYNTISLGLALWSFYSMTLPCKPQSFTGPILGSVFFSLALNFKQMELYHAPAVFAYLLGRCFRHEKGRGNSCNGATVAGRFLALGATVVLTFAVLWLPFALHPRGASQTAGVAGVVQVVRRLFPFERGIFEGKVANFWCALATKPFAIRERVPERVLPLAAAGLTALLAWPPCRLLFRVGRGDDRARPAAGTHDANDDLKCVLWGATSTSLAFFLASFQVHEKGILIALAPLSLLALDAPEFVRFFSILATWSLWPLLKLDRLVDAYFCCLTLFISIDSLTRVPSSELSPYNEELDIFSGKYLITRYIPLLSWVVMIVLHLSEWMIDPPNHLPDLYPVLWSFVGCGLFSVSYLGTLWAMMKHTKPKKLLPKKRKKNIPLLSLSMFGLLLSDTRFSEAFLLSTQRRNCKTNTLTTSHNLQMSSGKHDMVITQELLERARIPLGWEVQNAQEAKPILNLSVPNPGVLSLAEGSDETMSLPADAEALDGPAHKSDDPAWEDGSLWQVTERRLMDMGILVDDKARRTEFSSREMLTRAPQLLRFSTEQIAEAASFLISYTNSTTLIKADPSLLAYLADDLRHGLEEYLPNMMFRGNGTAAVMMVRTQLALSPPLALNLVRMGIEGGIAERGVSRALSSASASSSKATQLIAGDTSRNYKDFLKLKGKYLSHL